MTREELEAIKARERAASPGPWEVHDEGRFGSYGDSGPTICQKTGENLCSPLYELTGPEDVGRCRANTYFLANARTDIPALITALEEAWAEIERMKEEIAGCGGHFHYHERMFK